MPGAHRLPRLVIAAPASGHGKTTVATGLMAALRAAGHTVSGHKVGPDYIDPGYHALATGRPGRNLDPHLVGEERLAPLFLHGARKDAHGRGADIAVIEGVMGLYDGAIGGEGFASTAHVASVLQAPVVLVVDISHAARSIAAVVQGMVAFDHRIRIAGVILNKAGSRRHSDEVCSALEATGIPVLGVLSRDDGIVAPSRHLGLVPAAERADAAAALDRLAAQIATTIDLAQIVQIASNATDLHTAPWDPAEAIASAGHAAPDGHADGEHPVVAIAAGRAFTFRYAETEELLHAAGCRTAYFDPMTETRLPAGTAGIYLGGGFPEIHATGLTANEPLRHALREAVAAGVPTVAECAGLLYLCSTVDGSPMVGAIDAHAAMAPRLTLSYRTAIATHDTLLAPAGGRATGHEFHRTAVEPAAGHDPAWLLDGAPAGFSTDPARRGENTLHASYLHMHWAGYPAAAVRFADAVRRAPAAPHAATFEPAREPPRIHAVEIDLHHHGDAEATEGLVDLAVNVQRVPRPDWLDAALAASLTASATYPNSSRARQAIADRHLRDAAEVLPTAGGAEAFTLIARMRDWQRPIVVHPQFTEPEAALAAAGHQVERVLLEAEDDFTLDPAAIPDDADLVVVGNPTNPTGVLHPAATLTALTRPGRVVIVDEAFMDAVPGERHGLVSTRVSGLLVVRSLTKTWSIPGIRAGYVLGDAGLIAELEAHQPPWSVSAPACAAMIACSAPVAVAEAERRAAVVAEHRLVLVDGLADLGLRVAGTSSAPFVLVQTGPHVRLALREAGFAVRRCDTFPGLGPGWIRVAVRDPATSRALLTALATIPAADGQSEGTDDRSDGVRRQLVHADRAHLAAQRAESTHGQL